MTKDESRAEIRDMIDYAQQGYNQVKNDFTRLWHAYMGILDDEQARSLEERDKSRIVAPTLYSKHRRIVAALQEAYFTNESFCKVDVDNREDVAEMLQKAVDHYTVKEIKMFSILEPQFAMAVLYGTPCVQVYWKGTGVVVRPMAIDEVFYDPNATSHSNVRYLVHNIWLTRSEIDRYRKAGTFKIKKSEIDGLTEDVDRRVSDDTSKSRIPLQEVYVREDDGTWTVSTVYDESVFLRERDRLRDGLPFVFGPIIRQLRGPDERGAQVYGESPMRAMLPIHDEMTIRRNQQIDAVDAQLNPRYLTPTTAGMNPMDFASNKKLIKVMSMNAIKEVPTPKIDNSMFDIQRLDIEGQEAIGVTHYNSGIQSDTLNQTATGISILSQEANTRIQALIRACNENFMEPLFERITNLVWKYGANRFFPGVGDRDPSMKIRISVNTGLGATNKDIQLRNTTQALDRMVGIAQLTGDQQDMQNARDFFYTEVLPLMGIKKFKEGAGSEHERTQGISGVAADAEGDSGMGVRQLSGGNEYPGAQ